MTPKRPDVLVFGDNERRTMWRRGYVHGFNAEYVIWVFGFKEGTARAKVWGMSIRGPGGYLWVMARHNGQPITQARANGVRELPPIMRQILTG